MAIEPTLPSFPETLETIEQDSCNNTIFLKKPSGRQKKRKKKILTILLTILTATTKYYMYAIFFKSLRLI